MSTDTPNGGNENIGGTGTPRVIDRMQFIELASKALSEAKSTEQVARVTVEVCIKALGANAGSVALLSEDGKTLNTAHCQGYPPIIASAYEVYPLTTKVPPADAIRTRKPFFIETLAERNLKYPHLVSNSDHIARGAVVGLPLAATGRIIGGLNISFPTDRQFDTEDRAFIRTVAQICVQALARQMELDHHRAAEQALRDSEERHAAIVSAALDAVITIDLEERVMEWNGAAESTFGYTRDQAIGQVLSRLIIPERLRGAHTRGITHFLATGEGPALYKRVELPAIRASGEEFPVELTALPIKIGNTYIFTAYVRDISERERIAAQRRTLMHDMLLSVTDGKLKLCHDEAEMPVPLTPCCPLISLSLASGVGELRHAAEAASNILKIPNDRCNDYITAVSEAAMNAVIHGGGGQGQVYADANKGTIQVRVVDEGVGIAIDSLPQATLSRGYSTKATLGHGLKMIIEFVDRVYLLTGSTGTTIVIEQDRVQPLPSWLDN